MTTDGTHQGTERGTERILIHTPFGRDGSLIYDVLEHAEIESHVCGSMQELEARIGEGAGAVVLAEEALRDCFVESLARCLSEQPPWSDLPLLVLTGGGGETDVSRRRLRLLRPLGHLMLLERPLRPPTLVSSVEGALRARRHQYQIRELLAERQRDALKIQQSNDELRKANAELQQFVYSASHDLQEPLRIISIYTEMLKSKYNGTLDAKADQYIAFATEGASRMEQLLHDLLRYAQLTEITQPPASPVDANAALEQSIRNLQSRIDQSCASIECDPLPAVPMHEVHLQQVFQNLIGNALKYRTKENPRIQVRVKPQDHGWLFSVADNGIGIHQQYADLVFGVFKRLHKPTEYPGTGIGLAICKRIVDQYGGRIWVESEPGQGSTFYFTVLRTPAEGY